VTFAITNKGRAVHDFIIAQSDLKADSLTVVNAQADESTFTVVDAVREIPLRGAPTRTVTLAPGHYIRLCNIQGHYELGMHRDFEVN
jgi:uncharacterized cupredoxin-like copper-binding protein